MTITGTYSVDDLLAGAWVHLRRRLIVIAPGLVFFAFAAYELSTGAPAWAFWFPICFIVWVVGVVAIGVPYRCGREFAQRKDLRQQITFAPQESGLHITTAALSATKPWSDYLKWKEGRAVFLLYMSDRTFTVVPKRFFVSSAEEQSFRELVSRNVRRET